MDATDAAVGSAFGQGTNAGTDTNASLAASVFAVSGDPFGNEYGVAGQITTDSTPAPGTYSGVAEDVELDTLLSYQGWLRTVAGSYTIAANGYGSLTIGGFGGGNVSALQVYATDPTLDMNDPNNTAGTDVGGALLLEFDNGGLLPAASGVAIPQTDTTSYGFQRQLRRWMAEFQRLHRLRATASSTWSRMERWPRAAP